MLLAAHVQEGFLLAGEGGFRQVFGGGRGAHGDGDFGAAAAPILRQESRISSVQPLRKRSRQDPAADLRAHDGEPLDVIDVEVRQRVADALIEAALRQELAVGVRGGGEAAGHRHAEVRQRGDHLAERGVLAADQFDVFILNCSNGMM